MKGKAIKNIITTVGLPVLFGALIFALWQTKVLHALFGTDEIILPLPTRIGSIIGDNFTNMLPQIASTLIVALGGLVLGSILGYFIGVAGAVFKKWGMGGLTIVSAFNAIPLVALAPVINNWTRDLSSVVDIRSTVAKIITVTIFCTASMTVRICFFRQTRVSISLLMVSSKSMIFSRLRTKGASVLREVCTFSPQDGEDMLLAISRSMVTSSILEFIR